ncbi:hypothetical protein BZ25_05030, partial [Petrotoga sp. Shatin.DS.tank11.9.2.9.3]
SGRKDKRKSKRSRNTRKQRQERTKYSRNDKLDNGTNEPAGTKRSDRSGKGRGSRKRICSCSG